MPILIGFNEVFVLDVDFYCLILNKSLAII